MAFERKDQTRMIIFNMEHVTSIDSTGAHGLVTNGSKPGEQIK